MSDRQLLFVYGLLRPGQSGFIGLRLAGRVEVLGSDRVRGRLYHMGHYPAIVIGKTGIVHGEVLAIDDPAVLAEIDTYELYDPERPRASEYRRIEVDLLDRRISVQAYEYNRPVKDKPIIASGNWWSR